MNIKRKKHKAKKSILIVAAIAALLLGSGGVYYYLVGLSSNQPDGSSQNTSNSPDISTGAKIDNELEEYAQKGGGSGQDNPNSPTGGVVDTGGKDVDNKLSDKGIKSQSGKITLFSPTEGQDVSKSIDVKGTAEVAVVFYRIHDNSRGMIGNGKLSVVDGKFSGKLSVSTSAQSGTFEVYSFDSQGRETNHISVGVKF